jgi:hypothetical protein
MDALQAVVDRVEIEALRGRAYLQELPSQG